jgi:predicted acylesterase/phospholipase RssA
VSIGAINAVLAAVGQLDELTDVWQRMSAFRMYRPRLDVWNLPSWVSLTENKSLLRRLRDHVHWARLPHSSIQVFISATNIDLRQNELFTNSEITYRHVLASAAIPVLFPPVRIGKHWYIDGAYSHMRPLKPLLKAGADHIFTVFLSPRRPRLSPPTSLFEMADRVLEVILYSSIATDRTQIENTNEEIERLTSLGVDPATFQHKPYHPVKVMAIHPSRELGKVGSYLAISGDKAKELMELGMSDCYRVLKRHEFI